MTVRTVATFAGLAGIVLLLFGVASYGLTQQFDLWTAVHVSGGGTLLAIGIFLNLAGFRKTVTARGTRERLQAVGGTVVFCGILVTGNVLALRHPWRYDATENRIHTLADQTVRIVRGLGAPVELLAFLQAGDPDREEIEELLSRYGALSPKLAWRIVDPEREPQLADELRVTRKAVLVARSGETTAQTSGDSNAGLTEGAITNLILKVTRPGPHLVYMVTGHGEPSPDDLETPAGLAALAAALGEQNFEVRKMLLAAEPEVPGDALVLVVAGPEKPFIEHEVQAIRAYLARGGRVLLLLDPATSPNLDPLLVDYRLALGDDMVVDREQIPFLGARLGLDPIVENFPPHAVNRDFRERILLRQVRSVGVRTEGGLAGVQAQVIAETRTGSWAEKDYRDMLRTAQVTEGPDDTRGPVPVAVAVIGAAPQGETGKAPSAEEASKRAHLVVIGDADWVRNAHLGDFFNREWALNVVEWLAGQEDLVAERPRTFRASRLEMTQADFWNLFRLSVLLLPETLVILGLAVWWRRRSL